MSREASETWSESGSESESESERDTWLASGVWSWSESGGEKMSTFCGAP